MREVDPFDPEQSFADIQTKAPPIVGRIQALWEDMRRTVASIVPPAPAQGWRSASG
jgi:hypothetical protein